MGGILDWRAAAPAGELSGFDRYYLSLAPSFRAPHASFEQIEELLLVKGMRPDLFHGSYERDPQGRLFPRGALKDCVSIYGATDHFDVNSAQPALLAALGLSPETVAAIVAARGLAPFRSHEQLAAFGAGAGPGFNRLTIGGNSIFTLHATARLRLSNGQLSDLARSVAATVKFLQPGYEPRLHVLRWYDNQWAQ